MQDIKFSTLTLLNLAAEVEAAWPNRFENRKFDLDRMLEVLNDNKIFSDRDRKIIYLCFECNMTFDEIVEAENIPTPTVRYTIDIMYQKLFCFSKVYREGRSIATIAAYKLLDEGDTYLKLFGNQTYYEAAEEYIRNGRKFNMQVSRAHATIIALTLGFDGKDLDPEYLGCFNRIAREKFNLCRLVVDIDGSREHMTSEIVGDINVIALQSYLNDTLNRKVKIITAVEDI